MTFGFTWWISSRRLGAQKLNSSLEGSLLRPSVVRHTPMAIPVADTESHALWPAFLKITVPPFDRVFTNDGLTTRLLKEQSVKVDAVPYLERSSYSATNVRNRILEMKDWERLVPGPVASMVKSIGGVERVRSMIHKDLEGED